MKASIANFNNQEKTLYLIFDFVHIIKTVRNNWINQIDSNHTFSCPSFVSCESTLNVPFQVLRNLFKLEQNSVAKTAHRLTAKSCWPSSLERQNVNLAQQDWILSQKPLLVQPQTSPMYILLRRNSCRHFLTLPPTMSPRKNSSDSDILTQYRVCCQTLSVIQFKEFQTVLRTRI